MGFIELQKKKKKKKHWQWARRTRLLKTGLEIGYALDEIMHSNETW